MSRGGALKEWNLLVTRVAELSNNGALEVIGIWSHFARADEPDHSFNEEQLMNFKTRVSEARNLGVTPKLLHLSKSAAALTNHSSHFDLVRLGIAMYGLSPDVDAMGSSESLNLKPVMKLRARLHLVKEVPAGSQVGYGGTATTCG
jgi:alanine racemase